MKAYVYTHTRLDTNEIFYVGIGLQDNYKRASFRYSRTKHWNNIVKKCWWKVDIVADKLTWEDACKKEIELIKKYGRVEVGTGTLVNLTDGGEGPLNRKVTDDTKRKISKSRTGKVTHSEETKRKIGHKSKGRNCKKIINTKTGFIYNSIEEAAISISVKRTYLSDRLTGRVKNETDFYYL